VVVCAEADAESVVGVVVEVGAEDHLYVFVGGLVGKGAYFAILVYFDGDAISICDFEAVVTYVCLGAVVVGVAGAGVG
jgi:hypothetical protein